VRRVTTDAFLRAPLGTCALAGAGLVFCESKTLCGAIAWGTPQPADVRAIGRLFDLYQRPGFLEPKFDAVLDGAAITRVDADTIAAMVEWLGEHQPRLIERVRLQASVAPQGLSGYVMTGILPLLGTSHPFRMFPTLQDALTAVAGDRGAALANELTAIALEAQGLDPTLSKLRDLLRERRGDLDIHAAASLLAMSSRSLQRLLATSGTSFKDEQIEARLALASEMLVQTDAKVADIAERVHVSERTLNTVFRARHGCTPAEYRKREPR
jgi:AraC-like DNA-binding protein